jgi:hypothetical protein
MAKKSKTAKDGNQSDVPLSGRARPVFFIAVENGVPIIRKFSSLSALGDHLIATGKIDRTAL